MLDLDFKVENCGSVWRFQSVSVRAKELAENEMGLESWQWMGNSFCVDHRPASRLVEQLQEEGYVLVGEGVIS